MAFLSNILLASPLLLMMLFSTNTFVSRMTFLHNGFTQYLTTQYRYTNPYFQSLTFTFVPLSTLLCFLALPCFYLILQRLCAFVFPEYKVSSTLRHILDFSKKVWIDTFTPPTLLCHIFPYMMTALLPHATTSISPWENDMVYSFRIHLSLLVLTMWDAGCFVYHKYIYSSELSHIEDDYAEDTEHPSNDTVCDNTFSEMTQKTQDEDVTTLIDDSKGDSSDKRNEPHQIEMTKLEDDRTDVRKPERNKAKSFKMRRRLKKETAPKPVSTSIEMIDET